MPIDIKREIVYGSNDQMEAKQIERYVTDGTLRKIAPKLYTTNLKDSPESIVKRHWLEIVAWRLPGCLISHKSAQLLAPTANGNLFITHTFTKRIEDLPGLILNVIKGPAPIDSDIRFGNINIYSSSEYRWVLEVLQPARQGKDGEIKSIPQEQLEVRLERMITQGGEEIINAFRDKAREIANQLSMQREFDKLTKIISALLSTHDAKVLASSTGKARAAGAPMDNNRAVLFQTLHDHLNDSFFRSVPAPYTTESEFQLFAFFESYFSNYIEGTRFEVSEAKQIVETGQVLPKRREDSHDILGTYRLASSQYEMSLTPKNEDEFIELLRHRHRVLLQGREDMSPGMFKTKANRAGDTSFVLPELVEGTLRHGFRYYIHLQNPIARAMYMMFLCSEVHPFADGNGRTARLMMNAELCAAGQSRILVPTVYREDYILSLRKLSRQSVPTTYVGVLNRLLEFSAQLPCQSFEQAHSYLTIANAYAEPDEAHLNFPFLK